MFIKPRHLLKLLIVLAVGVLAIFMFASLNLHHLHHLHSLNPLRGASQQDKKIFCMILTTPQGLSSGKTLAQLSTWATKCSNYRFITVITDPVKRRLQSKGLSVDRVPSPLNLYHPHEWAIDSYWALTSKVYAMFRDVYREHGDYEFYMKADDDTFVNMDNLREFLSSKDPDFAATYGYDFKHVIKNGYPAGGPGYVLSRKAFRLLSEQLISNMTFCPNNGCEDMSLCLTFTFFFVNFLSLSICYLKSKKKRRCRVSANAWRESG
jgi:hypothetical protein